MDEFIATEDTRSLEDNLAVIFRIYRKAVVESLTEFGISYKRETPLNVLCITLKALLIIPTYGESGVLVGILEGEENIYEKFTLMLEKVTSFPFHFFLRIYRCTVRT